MSHTVIQVEGLGKRYQLGESLSGHGRYKTLRDAMSDTLRALTFQRSKPKAESATGPSDFWALRDINFEISQGDVVGIIGRNGAGKSTLLKLLSRITSPTHGRITLEGRVASLLEVGTGFHPELSGRENVYLNGAILGMSRREIARKFDEIVAFADVERFLDTPVKRYSSGMYVRLAFAVAAHLEPEILLVDEVLAVGDAAFQKKCLAKVNSISTSGRTIFFVSHNIGSILEICRKGILLDKGQLKVFGTAKDAATAYYSAMNDSKGELGSDLFRGTLRGKLFFDRIELNDRAVSGTQIVSPHEPMRIRVHGRALEPIPSCCLTFTLYREGTRLCTIHDQGEPTLLPAGEFTSCYEIPPLILRPGDYSVALACYQSGQGDWLWGADLAVITVLEEWGPNFMRQDEGWINFQAGQREVRAGEPRALAASHGL